MSEVTLDERVYAYLRNPDDCSPRWVRIAMLQDRMAGDGGPVHGSAKLVFVWNPETQQVEPGTITFSAARNYAMMTYFRDELDVPDWTRVVATCDIDGSQRATVTIDPAGLPESDYVGAFDDPFYNYLDEHRTELAELARRHYGAAT